MKIGILTHQYINNFGAFLQAYALCRTVTEMDKENEVYIINCINLKHFIINSGGWFKFSHKKESIKCWFNKIFMPHIFYKERKKYMSLTRPCFTAKAVNKMKFDCIIAGSDEIWNYEDKKGNAKIKFGKGLDCKRLTAYAPSTGNTRGTAIPNYVSEGIKKFDLVSARDELTENIVNKITGKKVQRVIDPTFLTDIPTEPVEGIKKPYVVFYYCTGMKEEEKHKIFDYAHKRGMEVYGAGECDKGFSKITVKLTPFQWVWLIKNAEYVVTGTFHGAVFSMINHRQFACFTTNKSRIEKMGSLLREFELENRQTDGSLEDIIRVLDTPIDYEGFELVADDKRKISREYISKVISH